MPANKSQQSVQSPTSPTAQTTAKYTNKDGSKFITVPKAAGSIDSPEPSPGMAQTTSKTNGQTPPPPQDPNGVPTTVNRKKQKRRQKLAEAARLAAGQSLQSRSENGTLLAGQERQTQAPEDYDRDGSPYDLAEADRAFYSDEEGDAYSGSYEHSGSPANGYNATSTNTKASKRKGKGKASQQDSREHLHRPAPNSRRALSNPPSVPPPLKTGMSKEKIWNTSSQEERERIKLFWLSLGEEERRSLVKVEKDAVLKKMKEQQKHSCSCTVCGRKRVAIEEELEVLYDAYYEELEQYANNHQGDGPPPMMAASRRFGPMSGLQPPNRLPPAFSGRQPSRGKIVEHFGNEDDDEIEGDEGDEVYSDDDYLSDEDPGEEIPRTHATDFFNFGQSLTVQGGILTVADDLLKNDGKKFIEMMEQLAERRMAREEDAKEQMYSNVNGFGHPPNGSLQPHSHHGHNHPPPPDDEDYDDEEEEEDDYDSQDDDYDEEEMDTMTEEQRMEEGRRMFQIFAARMFEQRVLTAYKEKVAAERQEKLIQELDEENMAAVQKKAKKAKDAQKKKEKAQQKKLALAEEKSRRDAEKAAEEAALRATEDKKAEEARLKAEEKRKKREAQKRAEDEERAKKEAEKQRRVQEQRERQADLERKQREAKERERKEKEEFRQKEKEAREAKERESKERKEKQEKERRGVEARSKAERNSYEHHKRLDQATSQVAVPAHNLGQSGKRPNQQVSIPIPAGIQTGHSFPSPHVPVATPAVPKAPTPNRPLVTSQKDPNSVPQTPQIGKSQSASSNSSTHQTSPGPIGHAGKVASQQPFLHHPQASPPIHAALKGPPAGFQPGPFPGMQPMPINGFHPGMPVMAPGFVGRIHHDPMYPHQQPMGNQFRPLPGLNGMHMHPGMNGIPMQQNRGFPGQHAPPGFSQPPPTGPMSGFGPSFVAPKDSGAAQSHSRQQSASFEKPPFESIPTSQPIARPAPIGRPSSIVHGQRSADNNQPRQSDIDDLANHLGSSALLDDSDDALTAAALGRRPSVVPSNMGRQGFGSSAPFSMEPSPFGNPISSYNNTWGGPPNVFGTSPIPTMNYNGWGTAPAVNYGAVGAGPSRPSQPRSVAVRLMLCRACKNLDGSSADGFHDISAIREQMGRLSPPRDDPVSDKELLDLCETEGNPNNGGGYFDIRKEIDGRTSIHYEPDVPATHRPLGAPGDIGSPVFGSIGVSRFPGPHGIPTPGGF